MGNSSLKNTARGGKYVLVVVEDSLGCKRWTGRMRDPRGDETVPCGSNEWVSKRVWGARKREELRLQDEEVSFRIANELREEFGLTRKHVNVHFWRWRSRFPFFYLRWYRFHSTLWLYSFISVLTLNWFHLFSIFVYSYIQGEFFIS